MKKRELSLVAIHPFILRKTVNTILLYICYFTQKSKEHLHRYVSEFAGRHNARELDTEKQMGKLIVNGRNRQLRYQDLIAHTGS